MIPARFSQSELNKVIPSKPPASKALVRFEPAIESSRHLESNALTTNLSRQDTCSAGM